MIRPSTAAWTVLAVGLCAGLFLVKQQVRGLEARLGQLNESILDDQQAIHVLRAEWSYLNKPSRLDELGRRLLHLELRNGAGITSIDELRRKHSLKPAIPFIPKPDLDGHISPLVSPGYAQPVSVTPTPDADQSNSTGWMRAIFTGMDGAQ